MHSGLTRPGLRPCSLQYFHCFGVEIEQSSHDFWLLSLYVRLADSNEVLDLAVIETPADIKEQALQKMIGTTVTLRQLDW